MTKQVGQFRSYFLLCAVILALQWTDDCDAIPLSPLEILKPLNNESTSPLQDDTATHLPFSKLTHIDFGPLRLPDPAPRPLAAITQPFLRSMSDSSIQFTWDSYRAMAVPSSDNVFFSPYSIINALGMLALGSSGVTLDQLQRALRINRLLAPMGFHQGISQENERLRTEKSALISVANRFFVDSGSSANIDPDYVKDLADLYDTSMQVVNFSTNPPEARRVINDWVSESTFGKINDFLAADLDPVTQLILANAIYFKGKWSVPFNADLTRDGEFQVSSDGQKVTVPFMYLNTNLFYARDPKLGVETVILPYADFKYAMHIILPDASTTLADVENGMTYKDLRKLDRSARMSPTLLKMPKFSLKQRLSLRTMLNELNATDVFNPSKSDFSKIFVNSRPGFFVDDVIHEALVEVNEEGTVAAGVTAVVLTRVAQQTEVVTVDRPFLFYISDESTGFILFWGRVENPTK